tara:strand:- start:81 stop:983 length:903 start_codon:yes stop_codon:yes gene_type:complete
MSLKDIKSTLAVPLSKSGKTSESHDKRVINIGWIEHLERTGLENRVKERQALIHTTSFGERLFIQYPGKESAKKTRNGKARKDNAIRPWDFRPKLYSPEKKEHHKDMTFGDIYAVIFKISEVLDKNAKEEILRMFATILYRMAFMHDYNEIDTFKTVERDITYEADDSVLFSDERENELPLLLKYVPDPQVLTHITENCSEWGQMSLEGFLFYNELLIWNEDCKYYYRNYHVKNTGKPKWINKTGRINTLLTHIRILGSILGDVPLSNILNDFANQRGVSPAPDDEILSICKDYVYKASK